MCRTHPPLCNCRDNDKLSCHGSAHYKIEWIYAGTKVSGTNSLELALEMKKKQIKIEKWPFFEYLVLACTINLILVLLDR